MTHHRAAGSAGTTTGRARIAADVILPHAEELEADPIAPGREHHRVLCNAFGASVAKPVIRRHPPCPVKLARSRQAL